MIDPADYQEAVDLATEGLRHHVALVAGRAIAAELTGRGAHEISDDEALAASENFVVVGDEAATGFALRASMRAILANLGGSIIPESIAGVFVGALQALDYGDVRVPLKPAEKAQVRKGSALRHEIAGFIFLETHILMRAQGLSRDKALETVTSIKRGEEAARRRAKKGKAEKSAGETNTPPAALPAMTWSGVRRLYELGRSKRSADEIAAAEAFGDQLRRGETPTNPKIVGLRQKWQAIFDDPEARAWFFDKIRGVR